MTWVAVGVIVIDVGFPCENRALAAAAMAVEPVAVGSFAGMSTPSAVYRAPTLAASPAR
jgi:hypothetical protein